MVTYFSDLKSYELDLTKLHLKMHKFFYTGQKKSTFNSQTLEYFKMKIYDIW